MIPAQLLEATTRDILGWYATGKAKPSQVVDAYLRRVAALDLRTNGAPPVNAVVCVAPDVHAQAEVLDREIASTGVTKALHGIPVWVKDNVDVQGLPTTSGCLALWDGAARADAELVAALRRAGAVIMGKTGMTELGNGTSAFSSVSGRIGNAYDPRLEPGGSSSGSAVAVAMNFGVLAVGVDDCSSIVDPAAHNGCVGLRPTVGLVSRSGVFQYSPSDTTPGPIARTVADAAVMLSVLAADPDAAARAGIPSNGGESVERESLDGVRVGVLESIGGRRFAKGEEREERARRLERCVEALQSAGAVVVHGIALSDFRLDRLSRVEYYNSMASALRGRSSPPRSVHELVSSPRIAPQTARARGRPLHRLGLTRWPFLLPNVLAGRYERIRRHNREVARAACERQGLDCFVAVTDFLPAMFATLTGGPHLTVPAGLSPQWNQGQPADAIFPFGLSFLGQPWTDFQLLRLGAAFERCTKLRALPYHGADEGPFPETFDVHAFNRIKKEIAEASCPLLTMGPDGYEHPTADEFKELVERLVATPNRTI